VILELDVQMPRYAFSPRDAARAGDIWRLCQEVATEGSTAHGWPPSRYRTENAGFVVRSMRCVHHRESAHGERLKARTWIREIRRGMIVWREIRIDGELGPLATASQEWVFVNWTQPEGTGDRPGMRVGRAPAALVSTFAPIATEACPELPEIAEPIDGRTHRFRFDVWFAWMDPLGHANHPMYLDWVDEGTSRVMAAGGLYPQRLRPVADAVSWRIGIVAPETLEVRTRLVGRSAVGDAILSHEILRGDELAASATTVRGLDGSDADALVSALR
jgi:acyl-CoA thioesterase FadM